MLAHISGRLMVTCILWAICFQAKQYDQRVLVFLVALSLCRYDSNL